MHELCAVHRLDRRTDRLAMPIESSRQAEQTVGVRRRRTDVERFAFTVEQVEVKALAAEIQTGVQHRNGPPLDSSQSTSWSLSLGRPFFMAFLTIAIGGKRQQPFASSYAAFAATPSASGCRRLRPLCSINA